MRYLIFAVFSQLFLFQMVEKKPSRFTIVNKRADAEEDQEERKVDDSLLKKRKHKDRSESACSSDSEIKKKKKKKDKKDKKEKKEKKNKKDKSSKR